MPLYSLPHLLPGMRLNGQMESPEPGPIFQPLELSARSLWTKIPNLRHSMELPPKAPRERVFNKPEWAVGFSRVAQAPYL